MTLPIITVSRQYGSAGRDVGRKVAEALEIPYYDKEVISMTAAQTGFSEEVVRNEERKRSVLSNPLFSLTQMIDVQVFMTQSEIIQQLAVQPCVIVGRCADYVLRDKEILSVFINAPLPDRIERVKTFYNRKERDIRALVLRTDKERKAYYEYYTDKNWGDSGSYDLMINSSIGLDLAKDLIVLAAQNWHGSPNKIISFKMPEAWNSCL